MSETFDERLAREYDELQDSRARLLLRLRREDIHRARQLWRAWKRNRTADLEDVQRRMDRMTEAAQ